MDERKLNLLATLCCVFGLALLYIISENSGNIQTSIPVVKAIEKPGAVISGQIISLKPIKSSSINSSNKRSYMIDIQTHDKLSAIVLNTDNIPLRNGDRIEIRGDLRVEEKNAREKITLLASEIRTIS